MQQELHPAVGPHPRRRTALWGIAALLFVWIWQAMACTEPPPLCSDEKPCPAGFLCRDGVCVCDAGSVRCGETCVFLATDPAHCGACGQVCPKAQVCSQGACACASPLRACGEACVDTQRDPANCGQCGTPCRDGEACVSGQCNNGCPDNAPNKCGARCTDTQRDSLHCGSCDTPCGPGLGCFDGKCGCPAGTRLCDGACVDLLSDAKHCGKCASACRVGQVCASGRCALSCPASTPTNCFGGCVDVNANQLHCGGCGRVCTRGQFCRDGRCYCQPEQSLCEGECVDLRTTHAQCGACHRKCAKGKVCAAGRCASSCPKSTPDACFGGCYDLQSDKRNCGTCGNRCPGLQVCTKGVCACPEGYKTCDGGCVDPLTNPLHCGDCGTTCADGQFCGAGKCAPTCPSETGQACFGGCFNTKADDRHCQTCGYACLGGSRCKEGSCLCTAPLVACDGLCLDLLSDQLHCGACGRACPAGERCDAGKCILDCDEKTLCGNVCVDTQSDATHCGTCDNKCEGGGICIQGTCGCDGGKSICGGACVDLQSDEQHCGLCGTLCKAGEVCVNGTCQRLCAASTLSACNGACFDLQISLLHCGSCGNACASGQSCVQGKCACPTGALLCGSQCVDVQVDLQHCGACGTACQQGEFCQQGKCKKCSDAAPVACGATCCLTGQSCCGGTACADLQSDASHCGTCGMACAAGLVCDKGKCTTCADGQTRRCYSGSPQHRNVGECADGTETCQAATWGPCLGSKIPSSDICDNKDNNCDGKIDEGHPTKGQTCTSGVGQCQAQGQLVCNAAGTGVECNATPGQTTAELCDNIDNDCNGQIDDGVKGPNCANQVGVCAGAKQSCDKGKFVACTAADFGADYEAKETKCDNKDNDCNGMIDEGLLRAGPLCTNQVGWCKGSQKSCVNGQWAACTAREFGVTYTAPQATETRCDGIDNDCDGTVDEGCVACLPTQALRTLTHLQPARWLDFSPDGKEVAAGAFLSHLRIWDVATGAILQTITTAAGPLGLQYNPFLAELGVSQADFSFYDPGTGMLIRALKSHLPTQNDLVFHPNGRQAITVGADQKLLLWDLKTYTSSSTLTLPGTPEAVAWSPDGTLIAVGMGNNNIYLASPTGGQPKTLTGHTDAVNSVAFSPDGTYLASTSADKTIRLWNASTGAQVWSQTALGVVYGVAWRWDSQVIAVGQSIFLELRKASDGSILQSIRAHVGAIADVSWSPDGKTIGTSSSDRTIKLWQCP